MVLYGRFVTHIIQLEKDSTENQYKSALLRTVSHELRTPINAVIVMTEMIRTSERISKETEDRLDIISGSCTYQLCLINDLLDYAQIIAGCLKISKIPFNITNILTECLNLIKIQLQGQEIIIRLTTLNLPETIISDPYRIKQILLNLLSNAKKFTIKGFISLEAEWTNKQLLIKCIDTGIGISAEKTNVLFTQFGRIDDTFSINPQGVGLGLAISNMLVKELGGDGIKVVSELGKGSCFSFSISLKEIQGSLLEIPEENIKIIIPSIFIKSLLNKIEVLIVDDTYFNVMALMQILKTEGINGSYSLNGEDALIKIKKKQFSCVLMDCEMPILDGWETTKQIYQLSLNHEISIVPPIIGCTSHSSELIRIKCLEVGMNDVIVKPCQKEIMIYKIKFWIEKSKFQSKN